jgi:hypothetical protein
MSYIYIYIYIYIYDTHLTVNVNGSKAARRKTQTFSQTKHGGLLPLQEKNTPKVLKVIDRYRAINI